MKGVDDAALLERARRGDEDALPLPGHRARPFNAKGRVLAGSGQNRSL